MLPMDIATLVAILASRPALNWRPAPNLNFVLLSCGIGVAGVLFAQARDQTADTSDPLEYLVAEMMVGKPWPLTESFHPELAATCEGRWLIFILRHDCEHCREMADQHFADPAAHRPDERTAVFVSGRNSWPFQFDAVTFQPKGDRTVVWEAGEPFVASPAIFVIEDGIVVLAADGQESDGLMLDIKDGF